MSRTTVEAPETLGQRAYREIRGQILDGSLPPGKRLSLRGMAGSLGMSMAPVSEAFRELSRDGLLETEAGWGTRVRRLSVAAIRSQHILRTALECEAVRQCAERAGDDQIAALRKLAEELDRRIDSEARPDRIHALDSEFHLRIAEYSGCASLVDALESNQLVRMLARGSILARNQPKPMLQHVRLVDAIASRNPDKSEQAMRDHCARSMALQLAAAEGHE